MTDKNG